MRRLPIAMEPQSTAVFPIFEKYLYFFLARCNQVDFGMVPKFGIYNFSAAMRGSSIF